MKVTQPPFGTPLNYSHPLSKGMVACYLLNEGGGKKAFDSTRLKLDGTLSGTSIKYGVAQKGQCCTSFLLSNHIALPLINMGTTNSVDSNLTISAWIYPTTVGTGVAGIIACTQGGNYNYVLFGQSSGFVRFAQGNFNMVSTASAVLTVNTWYHIAVTRAWSGSTWNFTMYVNGVINNTSTSAITPLAGTSTFIGNFNGSNWLGSLQNIMMWNRALLSTEVRSLYTNTYQMFK